ncbi:MAG: hypothetical protein PHW82_15645 [Bacteroidales bacterium]|nr:hypothetical protein [Bacteroidales bacterium]
MKRFTPNLKSLCISLRTFVIIFALAFSSQVFAQVLFTHTVDADFQKGQYNDMIVGSNNVYLPYQATAVNSWLTTTVLPQTLSNHKAATWNNRYIYVIGGYNGVNSTSTVYRATINATGISSWTSLASIPGDRRDHAVVIGNNTIYVLGGKDDTNMYNTIYYAKINTSGSIGTWQTSSVSLPSDLWGHTAVYCNGYIYVAGGADDLTETTATNGVYCAKVLADNTLSAFSSVSNLPATRNGHTMACDGDKIYVLGGFSDGGTNVNSVYVASSASDGSLGGWVAETPLPIDVSNHSSTIINGIITVMAGEIGGTLTKHVYFADITSSPFVWSAGTDMYDYTKNGVAFAQNGQIIYCGGENLSETPIHNTRYAPLTLSSNYKTQGQFISTAFTELGAERYITELTYSKTIGTGGSLEVSYRFAGDDKIWSNWSALSAASPIIINTTARYLQYKIAFTSNGTNNTTLHAASLSTPGTQLSGNLNAIPTFTAAASPYWVTGDITFTAGTHTFEAGTKLLFLPGITMEVGAANIICNGVAGDSVYFTSYTDEPGLWGGIYYNSNSSSGVSSQFNYTSISNAGAGTYAANLYCYSTSEPKLNHCDIYGSTSNGIRLRT